MQTTTYTPSYVRLLSRHAHARMQQRAVPIAVLARLLDYGAEIHDHRGAVILYFDKRSWQQLEPTRRQYVLKGLTRYRNVYASHRFGRAGYHRGQALP